MKDKMLNGYLLIKPIYRDMILDGNKIKKSIISGCDCVSDLLVNRLVLNYDPSSEEALYNLYQRYGSLTKMNTSQLHQLSKQAFDYMKKGLISPIGCINEIDTAKKIYNSFFGHLDDVFLIHIEAVNNIKSVNLGNFLGFDIIGIDKLEYHSFMCCNLFSEIYEQEHIVTNDYALFDTYTEAKRIADLMNSGQFKCEQMEWKVYMLNDYSSQLLNKKA